MAAVPTVAVPTEAVSMVAVPMVALQARRGPEVEIPRLQAEMLIDGAHLHGVRSVITNDLLTTDGRKGTGTRRQRGGSGTSNQSK